MGGTDTPKRRKVSESKTPAVPVRAEATVRPAEPVAAAPETTMAATDDPARLGPEQAKAAPTLHGIPTPMEQEDAAALAMLKSQPLSPPLAPLPSTPRGLAPAPTPFLRPRRSDGTKSLHKHCKVAPLEVAIVTYAKDGSLISEHFDSNHPVYLLMLLQKGSQSAPTMTFHWKDSMQKFLHAMATAPGALPDAPRQLDGLAPCLHSILF